MEEKAVEGWRGLLAISNQPREEKKSFESILLLESIYKVNIKGKILLFGGLRRKLNHEKL